MCSLIPATQQMLMNKQWVWVFAVWQACWCMCIRKKMVAFLETKWFFVHVLMRRCTGVCVFTCTGVRACVLTMYPDVPCVKARLNQVNHAVSSLACVCQECLCQARSIWTNQWEKTARRTLGMSDTHLVYKHTLTATVCIPLCFSLHLLSLLLPCLFLTLFLYLSVFKPLSYSGWLLLLVCSCEVHIDSFPLVLVLQMCSKLKKNVV